MKYPVFPKIALLLLEVRFYRRYFKERHIRYPFQPHEKHAVHTFFTLTKNPSRFFSPVSPRTVLSVWKNFLAKRQSYPHKGPAENPFLKSPKNSS
ncbi:MAG: hypothetical protein FWG27_00970 [Treponema sp.]|nr:hypothetical protein [Treponema sp.]